MADDKYAINYTMKMPHKQGYHRQTFKTKMEANKWLSKNKDKIYWSQLVWINPKSSKPRPLVKDAIPAEKYDKFTGTLETYFETGMECMGLVFYKDGIVGTPNPSFDPSKPESRNNFKFFKSYDGLVFLESGMILLMPNKKKVYLLRDREFSNQDGHSLSFYPQGFTKADWLKLFVNENVKTTLWIPKEKK